jgi:beta-lactamase class A
VNRKGKKPPLTRVKNSKAKRNSRGSSHLNLSKATVEKKDKPKHKRSKAKAIGDNNLRLKQSLAAKQNNVSLPRSRKNDRQAKKPLPTIWLAIYAITIAIGLSTILGTIVSIASIEATPSPTSPPTTITSNSSDRAQLDSLFAISSLGKEIVPLQSSLQQLAAQYPELEPEIFFVDLDNKGFVSINGKEVIASASTIKLPILVAFFQDVDRGKIALQERLVMTEDVIAEGSGGMQYQEPGTQFSALQTASQMITTSDNTATNMLIKRMGGMEELNQRFSKMGLRATRLRNPLPDLTGTNTTTPEDLGNLLAKIDNGKLISLRSRDRLLYIMRNLVRNTLLPEGLEPGAIIAHKTGDIKSVLGDAGIIDMPNGKRYIASILVKRPDNSPQAKEFIQQASKIAYQYFKNSPTTGSTSNEDVAR